MRKNNFKPPLRRSRGDTIQRISSHASVLALALFCSGCDDPAKVSVREACIKASINQAPPMQFDVASKQCTCAADVAEKYLDKNNYRLLAGVATIYNSSDPDDIKVHRLIDAAMKSGLTSSQATIAAMDLMFLAHKVSNTCEFQRPIHQL